MTLRSEVYGLAMKTLDALPQGSVVLDSDGDAWQKQDDRWTSVVRGANTELMGSNSLAILTPLTVVYRPDEDQTPPVEAARITIRHERGNTLTGTVEQVLSTHLAKGWSIDV
ncbi:hypothetical protein ACFUPZ_05420 [Microbacterium oxydans]|uniref:hypothetical protein n=1 Tax=Microbacterium oxydans TaxID=82380 RepID=UPI00362DD29F